MLEYKNLNNISDKLRQSIPPMNGEVLFQMLNGHKNNDMDRAEREKEPILYGKTQIPTFSRIKDPFANDGKGATVNIGVPTSFDANGNPTSFRPFLAGLHDGKFNGRFSLMQGKIQDEELYEVFWLLNENESNPNRDKSVQPLFRIVNYQQETKSTFSQMDILLEALTKVKEMKEEDYITFANSQGYTETDINLIKAQVSRYSKDFPAKFLEIVKDPNTEIKSNIKKSIDKGIMSFDARTKDVAVNGNKIMTVAKEDTDDYVGAIATWLKSAKNGKSVYEGMLKQLKQQEEPVLSKELNDA